MDESTLINASKDRLPDERPIAISVEHLTKIYKLYETPSQRFKETFHPLRKKYHRDFYALQDVSFQVRKGDTVGIIGRNGSGKSTLLQIITGVLTQNSGNITVNGRVSALLELGSGFNPEFTGIENIYLSGSIKGYERKEMDDKLENILAFAEIGDFVYQPVKTYSSGMYVRLAFAVAIMVEPEILIVDEALSVGDMNFQAKCMTAIDAMRKGGVTVLFVSHDMGSVRSLCSKAVYLENGMVRMLGQAGDVVATYIKDTRCMMNTQQRKFMKKPAHFNLDENEKDEGEPESGLIRKISREELAFREDAAFDHKVHFNRYGSGEARITFVELLDMEDTEIVDAEFNQQVKLRIHLRASADAVCIVNYSIFDSIRVKLMGSNYSLLGIAPLSVRAGDEIVVEFSFRVPLQGGNYAIRAVVHNYYNEDVNNPAVIDFADNALVFSVGHPEGSRLWTKVYLQNAIKIYQIGDSE